MQSSASSRPSSVTGISRTYTPGPPSPIIPGLASNGQVRITYTVAPSLQSSPHSAVVLESLRSRVQPLRNLHWRPSAGTLPGSSIRTVQHLAAELVPLDLGLGGARMSTAEFSGTEGARSQIPGTVLGKPFINLWLGMCEDADTYKNTIRRQLKDWVASVTTSSKRDQEWLIVLVNVTSAGQDMTGSGGKRLFQMKGSVIDRMRADFTLAKRDRCVHLNLVSGGQEDPAAWTDLVAKVKDAIVITLDARVAERMDDVRRAEAQRAVPGWNFCTFFVLKESLAESFEGMTLLDAALLQYTELEASFYQVLKEKNLSWFGKLGGTSPGDDAAPLLSVTKKPYRDLIMSNAISVFDFRCYLLARQCLLLAKMGGIADVASKAARFISSFARTLRENENSLSEPFLESWIYSCSLNVVDECDAWTLSASGQESASDVKDTTYNASKCELLELARAQLDKIGIRAGHLPRTAPFTTSLPDQPPKSRPSSASFDPHAETSGPKDENYKRLSRSGITNASLLQAIESPASFDELYKQVINRAIDTCGASGRKRSLARLKGILAALYLHRGELSEARSVYSSQPPQYLDYHWSILEAYMRAQDLQTSETSQRTTGEWLRTALALLKADLSTLEAARSESDSGRIRRTFEGVIEVAQTLSADIEIKDFSPLKIRLVDETALTDGSCDGASLTVLVTNTLPFAIEVECIKVVALGGNGTRLTFEHHSTELPAGESTLALFCPDPISGLFITAEHEYQISRLSFRQQAPKSLEKSSLVKCSLSEGRRLVRVPADDHATHLEMRMPRHVTLGDRRVLFMVHSGRNILKRGTLNVSSPGGHVTYSLNSAKVLGDEPGSIKFTSKSISFENLPAEQELVFSIPYAGSPRNDELEATINLSYTTVSQPNTTRNVISRCRAYVGLPLIVNINDKFRSLRLFTNVVIHAANHELVRVATVALRQTSDQGKLAIKACHRASQSVMVRPSQPAPFLFQLEVDPNNPSTGETLELVITYRSLQEDLTEMIRRAIPSSPISSNPRVQRQQHQEIQTALLNATTWIDMLELIRISPADIDLAYWVKELVEKAPVSLDIQSVTSAIASIRQLDQQFQSDDRGESSSWRTVTMPFDVPMIDVINRVQITHQHEPTSQIYAGEPINVDISIGSSFHWRGSTEPTEHKCMMRYDVSCEVDSGWLVCGPKRGEFLAVDTSVHTVQMTLLPLRHGALPFPTILVEPIESSEGGRRPSCETWQADGAKRILVFPRNARSTFVVSMPIAVT